MLLICGLGNPGKKYVNTRHNVGFLLIDNLVKKYNFSLIKKDKIKELYKGIINRNNTLLIKPLVFMNLSGDPINQTLKYYKIKKNNLYVIHDDLDLKTAKLKLKIGGSNGGHKGLQSIDNIIGKQYNRLRIGINHPGNKNEVSKYVLEKFTKIEKIKINNKLEIICKNFDLLLSDTSLFLTKVAVEEVKDGI